jgi:hypothetical protein
MKKTFTKLTSLLIAVLLILGTMSGALAAGKTDNIIVATGTNTFVYLLHIDPIGDDYASLQFDVIIDNNQYSDLQIASITYTNSFGTAAQVPTDKNVNGFQIKYQTGFVSTENQFSNADVKQLCSIAFQYTGSTAVTVTFDNLTLVRRNELNDGSVQVIKDTIDDWSRTLNVSRGATVTPGGNPGGGDNGGGQSVLGTSSVDFDDVHQGDWYYNAVQYVAAAKLIEGTTPTTFEPETALTRGMFATILYRMAGSPAVAGTNPFKDVVSGQWYTNAVMWAAKTNIVKGYTSDTFGPDDVLTREQLVTMLYRYASFKGYNVSAGQNEDLRSMTDAHTVASFATAAFKWAYAADIIHGTTPTTLSPQGAATRAQGAMMVMDFMESFVAKV